MISCKVAWMCHGVGIVMVVLVMQLAMPVTANDDPGHICRSIAWLQGFSDAILQTFVCHFTRFQLTQCVARSLSDS